MLPSLAQPVFSTKVLPFRTRVSHGFRSLGQSMLQPRLAMTAAMAFFSIALTMNLTGVRITDIRASDFKPSSIMRNYYKTKAKVAQYSDNLRVVYELESRVRDLQGSSDDEGSAARSSGSATPANQNAPGADQQPGDHDDQKPGSHKKDQKQSKPNPGSSRRETPTGGIQLAESVRPQAPPPFASQTFVVRNPSVFKQEGGLV